MCVGLIMINHQEPWKQQVQFKYSLGLLKKTNLIYRDYVGDGDTSSFKEVAGTNPYTA